MGWSQYEIADLVGLEQARISQIIKNTNFGKIHNDYQNGKTPEEIANYYNYDLPLVWAILLQGKTDLEIFETFGKDEYGNKQPKITDYWKFAKADPRLGKKPIKRHLALVPITTR